MVRGPAAWRVRNRRLREVKIARVLGPVKSNSCFRLSPIILSPLNGPVKMSPYLHSGDGVTFDPGPCDGMLINAGVIHPHVMWFDRLKERGRLVVPLTMAATPALGQGIMAKIVRERGGFTAKVATFLAIFSCTNGRDPQLEPLMVKALTTRALMKIKSIRRDSHEAGDTCILHAPEVCLSMVDLSAAHEAAAS